MNTKKDFNMQAKKIKNQRRSVELKIVYFYDSFTLLEEAQKDFNILWDYFYNLSTKIDEVIILKNNKIRQKKLKEKLTSLINYAEKINHIFFTIDSVYNFSSSSKKEFRDVWNDYIDLYKLIVELGSCS